MDFFFRRRESVKLVSGLVVVTCRVDEPPVLPPCIDSDEDTALIEKSKGSSNADEFRVGYPTGLTGGSVAGSATLHLQRYSQIQPKILGRFLS